MAQTFKFYSDANLTTEITGNLIATQNQDGSTPPVVFTIYYGSTGSGLIVYNKTNPGVAHLQVEVFDSATGSGHATTEVKLATTEGGLASATPGAALDLGASILSGVANKKTIWVEVNDATHVVGNSTELSLRINNVREMVA